MNTYKSVTALAADNPNLGEYIGQLERERDEHQRQLAELKAFLDRVWKALGISTYEQAKPYSIDEHVANLKQAVEVLSLFTEHDFDCELRNMEAGTCNCGLNEALANLNFPLAPSGKVR